jgi:hypothetical protein
MTKHIHLEYTDADWELLRLQKVQEDRTWETYFLSLGKKEQEKRITKTLEREGQEKEE